MSPVLAACAAVPPAIAFGSAIGAVVGTCWLQVRERRGGPTMDGPEVALTESDRKVIEEEFTVHAVAVADQVGVYADELAGGDVLLRERLRRIERHARGGGE